MSAQEKRYIKLLSSNKIKEVLSATKELMLLNDTRILKTIGESLYLLLVSNKFPLSLRFQFISDFEYITLDKNFRDKTREWSKNVLLELWGTFFKMDNTKTWQKIVAGQYLLQHEKSGYKLVEINKELERILNSKNCDAADTLLHLGDSFRKLQVQQVIEEVSFKDVDIPCIATIYDVSQNAFYKSLTFCALSFLKVIIDKVKKENINLPSSDILAQFQVLNLSISNSIKESLLRIMSDHIKFEGLTLAEILNYVWNYIALEDNQYNTLTMRLWEELQDMHNTCSTGCMVRLVNSVIPLRIEWKDQVTSNVKARIFERVKKDILRDKLLENLTEENSSFFDSYVQKNRKEIENELVSEFAPHFNKKYSGVKKVLTRELLYEYINLGFAPYS